MSDDDVPARVMAALQDADALPVVAGEPDFWARQIAYHEAREQAWLRLDQWAAATGEPLAVRVALASLIAAEQADASNAAREALRDH